MSTNRKLTRAERQQIAAAIARAKQQTGDKKHISAQDTISYQRMWPDGICRVTDTRYTKTIRYQDINYQLNTDEDKDSIFRAWCGFLNYFDSSIHVQLSFLNLNTTKDTYAESVSIPAQNDAFNHLRNEYTTMLQNQLAKGNNGLVKTKYLTFGIDADSIRAAKPRLERIETDVLNNFKRLGVKAEILNGAERLEIMHSIFHMDTPEPFSFSWDWLPPSGLSTKDFIAPSSFEFANGRMFRIGRKFGCVSFVQILAPELNDRMLADFLDMESSLLVNLHIQSVDQTKAIKTIKRKITDLDKMKIEEQKKAVRAGYDMDIIPSDLATYGEEAKRLLQDLQSRNERMFLLTFLVMNTADTQRQLDNTVFQASSIAQKHNCALTRLDFQQEEALMSCLPLGYNHIDVQRALTTSSTAIFIPFTTQELFQSGHGALYILTEEVAVETRYRTETETRTREVVDPDTGVITTEEYEEEVEVPYDYYIANISLENFNLSHLPIYTMSEYQLSLYAMYMSTLGNRPDLFPASSYIAITGNYTYYGVPPEALEDEVFAAVLAEDGWMIHCGNPIQYANINTSYWQSHFYGFGRLPSP